MTPKIPIGVDDFRNLRNQGYVYVDKSLFVRDVLRNGAVVLLLPRPRRFGKTLNLSMLRCFLDRSASDARALFDGLALAREDEDVWQHAHRYPVVALTLKEVRADTWDMTYALLRDRIRALFGEHREVLEGGKLDAQEEEFFRRMLDGSGSPADHALSLLHLSAALQAHHGQPVFLLLDEYDAPIHAAYVGGYLNQALDFFRIFLGAALKQNQYMHKGVLTGILRVARENIFSGLNNLDVCTLLNPRFRDSFGFTEPEVTGLLERVGLEGNLDVVRLWYNGYLFGGEVIYNPWSVLSFIHNGAVAAPYWVNTSSNELVRGLLQRHAPGVQPTIELFLQGGAIERRPDESLVLSNLETDRDALWSLLLFTGYLKAELVPPVPGEQASFDLSIPNLEVRQVYLQTFADWLRKALARRGGALDSLLDALLRGDARLIETQLSAFVTEMVSYHDLGAREPERVYQAFVLGLLAALAPDYEVRSNREAGQGRADVLIRPKRPGRPGVVLELKVARSKSGLARALEQGFAQVREKGYLAELASAGAEPMHVVAVAFDGKNVRVKAADAASFAARPRAASKRKRSTRALRATGPARAKKAVPKKRARKVTSPRK